MLYNRDGKGINSENSKSPIEMIGHLAAAVRILDQQYSTMRGVLGTQQAEIKKLEEMVIDCVKTFEQVDKTQQAMSEKIKDNRKTIEGLATWITATATRLEVVENKIGIVD